MNASVCTLFEGHYHYGVAALTNSLYSNGYRGAIYAGYKGELPLWIAKEIKDSLLEWPGSGTFEVDEGLVIHFLPIDSNYHLSNYKPYFMMLISKKLAINAGAIAYFDPDIVIKCKWNFFEKWMSGGVALVHEIANDPMPSSHPIRLAWIEVLKKLNRTPTNRLDHYFNAGFCGVAKNNIEFIKTWCDIIDLAINDFGFSPSQFSNDFDRTCLFEVLDQDALNIAAMCTNANISEVGPDGMDFINGGWIMSHATGSIKPWKKNFIISALKGFGPSIAERNYWKNVSKPISIYSYRNILFKLFSIRIAGLIGRFYRRN